MGVVAAAEVEYRILGPLQAIAGGKPLLLGGRAQRALLAVLLLHANEAVSVDRLVEAIWGDGPPATAAHAIEVHVSNLRGTLGADKIERSPGGYMLRVAPGRLDLGRFEDLLGRARREIGAGDVARAADLLHDALALWRGPALADFEFDEFAQAAIARLDELRLTAVKARIDADLGLGKHEELVPELRALVAAHPYDEKLHGLLMLALYRSGRQADALGTYQDILNRLREELGLDPAPALRALQTRILAQDTTLDPPEAKPVRSVVVAPSRLDLLEPLRTMAEPLGRSRNPHELILVWIEDAQRSDEAGPALSTASTELARAQSALRTQGVETRTAAFTMTDRAEDLLRLARRPEVDLLVLSANTSELENGRLPPSLSRTLGAAQCDVAIWLTRDDGSQDSQDGPILVPFGALEHDWAALELGSWLAGPDGRALVLLGASADSFGARRDASRMLADAGLLIQRATGVSSRSQLVEPGRQGLLDGTAHGGLLVIGLSERWEKEGLGTMRWEVAQEARTPVVVVKRGLRPGGISPPENLTRYRWSVTVGT